MATFRALKTMRSKLAAEAADGRKARFARELGIHLTTLNSLLEDNWERIERDTIERLCDYFQCSLSEVLSLEPDRFWQPFVDASSYSIFRGSIVNDGLKKPLEEDAKTIVTNFLEGRLLMVSGGYVEASKTDAELVDYARNHSCIVIGAHASNTAWEILMSRHFRATPNDISDENRRKIPFRLARADRARESAISEEPRTAGDSGAPRGIFSETNPPLIRSVDSPTPPPKAKQGYGGCLAFVLKKTFPTG